MAYKLTINYNPAHFGILLKYLQPKTQDKILEIGCARGFYVKKMEKYTKNVIGVDIDQEAAKRAVSQKVKYGDATSLDFPGNIFNKIYSINTIEHIFDLRQFFHEITRVLEPGGIVLLIYPWEPIRGIQAIWAALINFKNPFMAQKVHLHKLNPEKIKKLIKNTPLEHIESKLIFTLGFNYVTLLAKK